MILPIFILYLSFFMVISIGFTGYSLSYASKIIGTQEPVKLSNSTSIHCSPSLLIYQKICVGTDEDDIIIQPLHGGTIFGLAGDDTYHGLLGGEVVFAGKGNDVVKGGNGTSTLFGNDGDDKITGGGNSNMFYGVGSSFMYGGDGDDILQGGFEHDIMVGGKGKNTFICSGKEDIVLDFDPSKDIMQGNCVII